MQSQMQQSHQPIFKPLHSSETSGNMFNIDQTRSRMNQNVNQNVAPFQLARPNEMHSITQGRSSQQQQQVEQNTGTERLSSLHAKLHQEADKIRKWKVQTEIELKQKEKKILEASTTVESLRKSILDLQLQNENLSLKLKEEMDHREDIIQRISSTRDLCNILKTHTGKMDEKLMQCETEKTQLKYLEKEHLQQFEDLSTKFKQLEITSVEEHNKLINQLNLERDDRSKTDKEMEVKLANTEVGFKKLIDQCDDKEIEIRDLGSRLQRNEDMMHSYQQDIETNHKSINKLVLDLKEKDGMLQEYKDGLEINRMEKNELEENLNNLEIKLQDSRDSNQEMKKNMLADKSKFESKLDTLEQELEITKNLLEEKMSRIEILENEVKEYCTDCENLQKLRDVLMADKNDLEFCNSDLKKKIEILKSEQDSRKQEIHRLQTQFSISTSEMEEKSTLLDELQLANETLQNEIGQKEIMCNCLKNNIDSLNDVISSKETYLLNYKVKEENLTKKLQTLSSDYEALHENFNKLVNGNALMEKQLGEFKIDVSTKGKDNLLKEKEITKLKKEVEEQRKEKGDVGEELEMLQGDLFEMRKEQENLNEEIAKLKDENEKLLEQHNAAGKSLNSERESKSKKMTDLEHKQKELKSDVSSKNKQIKELEKELKSTKSKLCQKQKVTEDNSKQMDMIKEEILAATEENVSLRKQLDDVMKQIDSEKKAVTVSKNQLADMKSKMDQALKEKNDSSGNCEAQMSEMMATLQKYKQENQKIVEQKEKEVESLKAKHEQSVSSKEITEQLCGELKQETETLKKALDVLQKEKESFAYTTGTDSKVIKELKSKLSEKEKVIEAMKIKSEKEMTKAASQTSCTQTSPLQVASTPLRRTFVPSTPKLHPTTSDFYTPKMSVENHTPQRSILRGLNSVSKKRRVAFIPDDEKKHESDSSSSELMEVEPSDIEQYKKGKTTPLHIRPSPRVVLSESQQNTKTPPLHRVPRGPPVKPHIKQHSKTHFSGKENEFVPIKEPEPKVYRKKESLSQNMRKAPAKSPKPKFFSISPRQRKEALNKKANSDKVEDMAWFDLDSVFGFGPED